MKKSIVNFIVTFFVGLSYILSIHYFHYDPFTIFAFCAVLLIILIYYSLKNDDTCSGLIGCCIGEVIAFIITRFMIN